MADTKITALTALTAADPANDVIPIVDVSDTTMAASGTTKKISVNNILGASGTATLASATITGAATVGTTLGVTGASTLASVGVTGAATVGTTLVVGTNATLTNGNVIIGTSGKGIDFSATTPDGTGTVTSELLNDYEEGTWTPVVADAGTGGNVGTYSNNGSTYTKIGRQVSIQTYISAINTTGMTAGNFFRIRGLPFTAVRGGNGNFYTYRVGRNASTVSSSVSLSDGNSNVSFPFYTTNSATTDLGILVSDIVSGTSEIALSLTYFV